MSVLILSVAFAVVVTIEETVERWKERRTYPRIKVYRSRPRRFD